MLGITDIYGLREGEKDYQSHHSQGCSSVVPLANFPTNSGNSGPDIPVVECK